MQELEFALFVRLALFGVVENACNCPTTQEKGFTGPTEAYRWL